MNWRRHIPTNAATVMVVLSLLAGCSQMVDTEEAKQELLSADRAFSALSVKKGMRAAFGAYMADDVVIYRGGAAPIEGRIVALPLYPDNPEIVLQWEPWFADVAASGDIGYTLGSYTMSAPDSTGVKQESTGNYVSIWKRQADGSWKFVFDTGHPGPRRHISGQ